MRLSWRALQAASFILLTGITASCSSGGADNVVVNSNVLVPGINLSATPPTIILDPNDPNAPRDPVTQKLVGATTCSARSYSFSRWGLDSSLRDSSSYLVKDFMLGKTKFETMIGVRWNHGRENI